MFCAVFNTDVMDSDCCWLCCSHYVFDFDVDTSDENICRTSHYYFICIAKMTNQEAKLHMYWIFYVPEFYSWSAFVQFEQVAFLYTWLCEWVRLHNSNLSKHTILHNGISIRVNKQLLQRWLRTSSSFIVIKVMFPPLGFMEMHSLKE